MAHVPLLLLPALQSMAPTFSKQWEEKKKTIDISIKHAILYINRSTASLIQRGFFGCSCF